MPEDKGGRKDMSDPRYVEGQNPAWFNLFALSCLDFKYFEDFASTSVTVRSIGKQGG